MKSRVRAVLTCLLLLSVAAACDDTDVTEPPAGDAEAVVSVYLTDAPGDVEAVWVDVHEIYLQGGGEGRTVLLDEPTGLIELTSLAGTTTTLVQDATIEAANYGQLRFVIGGAVLETTDGRVFAKDGTEHPEGLETTGELHCPSCGEAGIRVLLGGNELDLGEGEHDLLLDFDVMQSVGREAGASNRWVMNPVIHGIDMVVMGSITGTVALAVDEDDEPTVTIPECPDGTARSLADFVPTARAVNLTDGDNGTIVRSGSTDESGAFRILALASDEYTLGHVGSIELEDADLVWTADVDPGSVTVGEGEEVSGVVFTITGASCQTDD